MPSVPPDLTWLDLTWLDNFCQFIEYTEAFVVQWEVNTTLEMPTKFAIYTKCNESPLLSERYTLCGAKAGIGIDAEPITITVDPWTGRPESFLRFTVVPKSSQVKHKKDKVMISKCKKSFLLCFLIESLLVSFFAVYLRSVFLIVFLIVFNLDLIHPWGPLGEAHGAHELSGG